MKHNYAIVLSALALGASAALALAQQDTPRDPGARKDPGTPRDSAAPREGAARDGAPREGGPRDAGGPGRGMQMPMMIALDTNKDGVIDAAEIANAPAALKTLDKNNDGKITMEEMRPARGDGPAGADRPRGDRPGADRPRGDRPAEGEKKPNP